MANNSRTRKEWVGDDVTEIKNIDDEDTKVPVPVNNMMVGGQN